MKAIVSKAARLSMLLTALICAVSLTLLALPSPAHAAGLFDIPGQITDWLVNDILKPPIQAMFDQSWDLIGMISVNSILTAPFDSMLGAGGTTVYDLAESVNDSVVKPIALSVLALAMLVQLIHVAGKADQDAAMPILRDLVMIALFYVCFRWLINYSTDLCVAVYTDFNEITSGIATGASIQDSGLVIGELNGFGEVFMMLLNVFIVYIFAFIAVVVSMLMAYMRAIQLYIFAAFAPIPLALLGFEQTRQFGIGFIKNFVALVLAGAVMVFILFCFPLLVNAAIAAGRLGTGTSFVPGLGPVTLIAMCLLLIIGMLKSGSIARSVLGE